MKIVGLDSKELFTNKEDGRTEYRVYEIVSRAFSQVGALHLTASEGRLLHFITWRTLWFGKDTESVSYRDIQDGVFSRYTGEVITAGIGLRFTAINACLKSLAEKQLITVSCHECVDNRKMSIRVLLPQLREFLSMCALHVSRKYAQKMAENMCGLGTSVPVFNNSVDERQRDCVLNSGTPVLNSFKPRLQTSTPLSQSPTAIQVRRLNEYDNKEDLSKSKTPPHKFGGGFQSSGKLKTRRVRPSPTGTGEAAPTPSNVIAHDFKPSRVVRPIALSSTPVREVIAATQSRGRDARAARLSDRKGPVTHVRFFTLWKDTLANIVAETGTKPIANLTRKEVACVCHAKKNDPCFQDGSGLWQEYVVDVLENWSEYVSYLLECKIHGFIPVYPDVMFFLRLENIFRRRYIERTDGTAERQKLQREKSRINAAAQSEKRRKAEDELREARKENASMSERVQRDRINETRKQTDAYTARVNKEKCMRRHGFTLDQYEDYEILAEEYANDHDLAIIPQICKDVLAKKARKEKLTQKDIEILNTDWSMYSEKTA